MIFQLTARGKGSARCFALPIVAWARVIALALGLGPLPAVAQPKPSKSLTVERIYSAPSLSGYLAQGVQWSPDAKSISFLDRRASGVEMWSIALATGERR